MHNNIFNEKQAYSFIKVEDYFANYQQWQTLDKVTSVDWDQENWRLTVDFSTTQQPLRLALEFIDDDIFRVRFNPANPNLVNNIQSIVQQTTADLRNVRKTQCENVRPSEAGQRALTHENISLTDETGNLRQFHFIQCSKQKEEATTMAVLVHTFPNFQIEVKIGQAKNTKDYFSGQTFWRTAVPGIFFTPNGPDDYAIIQVVEKPADAKFIGFGEQGGVSLSKNNAQVNYFNFDNMRYMQVYNRGPLDARQPLYHSEPIFFQYNSVPASTSASSIFVANVGQVLMDVGYENSQRYMFGTRFNDLDYFFMYGKETKDLIYNITTIIGRSHLKPRYVLGYHQGCYGYEKRADLQWCVQRHRYHQIPLDGLHIDVDLQNEYQTFTINTNKFPDPKGMFSYLRDNGVKCSTNITPVISLRDNNYSTYKQFLQKGYFVKDNRYKPNDIDSRRYQCYQGGNQYQTNNQNGIVDYNSGKPFIGGVYYGNDKNNNQLGTQGHYPDLGRKEVREQWGKQYAYLMQSGLEFIWQDMTTPAIRDIYGDMKSFPFRLLVTPSAYQLPKQNPTNSTTLVPFVKQWNMYSYNLHKATFKGLAKLPSRANKRNFIIGRGSFTGSHRYAGLWTGDNSSTWNFLKINVSQALSLGMTGVVINGQDIGGFEQDKDNQKWINPELLIRWTAAGAFLPWFRNHYVRKGRKEFQEIFQFTEYFQTNNLPIPTPTDLYQNVLPICRHYIQLRYRLLQLFYDLMFENTLDGAPICRPLFYGAPNDSALFNDKECYLNNEFFVGRDLLIAPILWPSIKDGVDTEGRRDVYLPAGFNWYHFKHNTQPLNSKIEGGKTIRGFDASLNAKVDHIDFIVPIYVKEGAIIPTIEVEQYVGEKHKLGQANPITFNIYPGSSHLKGYSAYLDDGVSLSSESSLVHPHEFNKFNGQNTAKDEYRKLNVKHQHNASNRVVVLTKEFDNYKPFENFYFLALINAPGDFVPSSVTVDNKNVTYFTQLSIADKANSIWNSSANSCYFNQSLNITFIKVFDNPQTKQITVVCSK